MQGHGPKACGCRSGRIFVRTRGVQQRRAAVDDAEPCTDEANPDSNCFTSMVKRVQPGGTDRLPSRAVPLYRLLERVRVDLGRRRGHACGREPFSEVLHTTSCPWRRCRRSRARWSPTGRSAVVTSAGRRGCAKPSTRRPIRPSNAAASPYRRRRRGCRQGLLVAADIPPR